MSYTDDYIEYRGKCQELCDALILEDPTLTRVRGHYYEPAWNKDEAHWWCVNTKGEIVDPSKKQFPSGGITEFYKPFDGFIDCSNCGQKTAEADMKMIGSYPCCSERCCLRLVGL